MSQPLLPSFSPRARVRLSELLRKSQPEFPRTFGMLPNEFLLASKGVEDDLFDVIAAAVAGQCGIDLRERGIQSFKDALDSPDDAVLALILPAVWMRLDRLRKGAYARSLRITGQDFQSAVNQILEQDRSQILLVDGRWLASSATEIDAMCKLMLSDQSGAAACRQGDVQVEIVASTVQAALSREGTVLIDYGAGLGRVLAGLASAPRLHASRYIAVDEPIPESMVELAASVGASVTLMSRKEFQASGEKGDVIMVVNTLHHIPFSDIPAQIADLCARIRHGGFLLIHEMARFPEPEQRNVAWRLEDLLGLFPNPTFEVNPRTTESRRGVPLVNAIIRVQQVGDVRGVLEARVRQVWASMKSYALEMLQQLYESHDESRHRELQHWLFTNANLDLNRPC